MERIIVHIEEANSSVILEIRRVLDYGHIFNQYS
jgi:hypothetical protein